MRIRSLLVVAVLASSSFTAFHAAPAAARTELSRQEIRSLPIETRPNRPGHFYGNTVRRIRQR